MGNVPWKWGPVQEASFSILRKESAKVLDRQGLYPGLPIMMYTDTSKNAIGMVLTQIQNCIEVPILYDSATLTRTQKNYGTYMRELLAIVTFARKYDYLLCGRETIYNLYRPQAIDILYGLIFVRRHICSLE